jgi:hypothetical protein
MLPLQAAGHDDAGKRNVLRGTNSGLLRWAREKEHGACNERRAKEAAMSAANSAARPLRHPHLRSALFTGVSGNKDSCLLDVMSCSVALGVMPHSATSRATGDDMSAIIAWNSGV